MNYYTYNTTTKKLTRKLPPLMIGGVPKIHPSAEEFAKYHAYPEEYKSHEPIEGKIAVQDGYDLENNKWVPHYKYEDAPVVYRTFSKLKMVVALEKAGIWDQIKSWLEANNLYDKYLAAQNFGEDNEYFKTGLQTLQAQLGWTDEQVENLLNACVIG